MLKVLVTVAEVLCAQFVRQSKQSKKLKGINFPPPATCRPCAVGKYPVITPARGRGFKEERMDQEKIVAVIYNGTAFKEEELNICTMDHEVIAFECATCPLCEAREEIRRLRRGKNHEFR